jgi:predicted GIY-YIG superfamily endonuclease
MDDQTALYRFFAADNALLYVGVTRTLGARWSSHAKTKPWWPEVHHQTVEWFDSRDAALAAEKVAIKSEGPRYNDSHVPRPPKPPGAPRAHTQIRPFRVPDALWNAFGRFAEHKGTNRTALLLEYMRTEIGAHGDEQDIADLAAAEFELEERRSRRGRRKLRQD